MHKIAAVTTANRSTSLSASMRRVMLRVATRSRVASVAALFVLAACGDSPTAPSASFDLVAAGLVIPSLTDARTRLVPGIDNAVIRERMAYDLAQLALALANGDGQQARFHLRVTSKVLNDYSTQGLSQDDAADVSALALMLRAVSQAVGGDFDIAAFPVG